MIPRPLFRFTISVATISAMVPTSVPTPRVAIVAAVDSVFLANHRWRNIGPDRGGRSIAASGVKGRPQRGVLRRGGRRALEDDRRRRQLGARHRRPDQQRVRGRGRGERDESRHRFIGMGETCIRGNIMPGDGVYKSHDAGKTWTHVGFRESHGISKIRIHPTNPDIVFVAAFGKYSVPSAERGVFKSTDGGKTWRKVLYRDDKTGAIDISIDREQPERDVRRAVGGVPQGIPDVERRPGQRSVQEHRRRRDVDRDHAQPGNAAGVVGRIGVAVSGANANRVYALVENDKRRPLQAATTPARRGRW